MTINIETHSSNEYDEITSHYGTVLDQFGLSRTETDDAQICIDSLDDLWNLAKELETFAENAETPIVYLGLTVKTHKDGTPYLEIKDNYD